MGNTLEVLGISQRHSASSPRLFENVTLKWESPGIHVIMGHSGVGKSTLLKCLGGVWRPTVGDVLLDGKNLWQPSKLEQEFSLVQRIGFAFQNNALFNSMRNLENLLFPHRQRFPDWDEKDRRALGEEWLKKVGLEANAYAFPHELSGGMQKRLAIARALILSPDFIFLDDPTAGLDPITSRKMSGLLGSLLEGSQALVVVVTNDPDRARNWGKNIHFLYNQALHSPGSAGYTEIQRSFL